MITEVRATKSGPSTWVKGWSMAMALFLAAPVLAREQITIQKSGTNPQLRASDATLDQANPNTKNGAAATLTVQSKTGNQNQRALVEFDLSLLPNVAIKQAQLILHVITPPLLTRTYGAYQVTSFFNEPDATWNTRVATTPWGAAGGDFNGTVTNTGTVVGVLGTTLQIDVTAQLQSWYNATPDYGTLIRDQAENDLVGASTVFGSKEAANPANVPQLNITFVQNVTNLAATPGNGTVTLSWGYPAAIGSVNPGEPYVGVVILRRANLPVDKGSVPTDTVDPALCSVIGTGTVVFDNSTNATSFADDNTDTCGAPTNGTNWFYKVFLRDKLNYYSTQPIVNGSTFTKEVSALPNATVAGQQTSSWIAATFSTNLAAPSLIPGSVIMVQSQTNLLFGIDATTGYRKYPPIAIGGPVISRSPLIDSGSSSTGKNVIYVADTDNLVYAVNTDTGQIIWVVNPTGTATNLFQGSSSVQLKSLSGVSFTPTNDLVTLGTRNGATTTGNKILGLDGNTGATLWTITGNAGGVLPMDILNSAPTIDYVNQAIWVTSRAACGVAQPSLWKLNPNTGAVLNAQNLGDVDADPTLTFSSDVLFVANNGDNKPVATCVAGNSTLYAINPVTGATLGSFNTGDGSVVDYPVVLNSTSPYTILFSGATQVHAVSFDKATNIFTPVWATTVSVPSAPISITGQNLVFVGSNDGKIHELNLATGADIKDEVANSGQPGFVGDPSLDLQLSRVYISTTDQRAYGFVYPF
ncbi:MAG: DNRLRE domain-containing protein [Candidatus Acidiferrales bacterium]